MTMNAMATSCSATVTGVMSPYLLTHKRSRSAVGVLGQAQRAQQSFNLA